MIMIDFALLFKLKGFCLVHMAKPKFTTLWFKSQHFTDTNLVPIAQHLLVHMSSVVP